jgi:quinol monooxygenase YgiN
MVYTLVVHLRAKADAASQSQLKQKLIEASQVYSRDKETVGWHIMQSTSDPQEYTIIERYASESSQKYHLENPYWKTFDPYVLPLLEKEMDLRRYEELDASKEVKVEGEEVFGKIAEYQKKTNAS